MSTNKINIEEMYLKLYKEFQEQKYPVSDNSTYCYKSLYETLDIGRLKYNFWFIHYKNSDKIKLSLRIDYHFLNGAGLKLYFGKLGLEPSFQQKEFTKKILAAIKKCQTKLKTLESEYAMEYGFLKLTNHHFKTEQQ